MREGSSRVFRVGGENVIKLRAKSNFYNCRITSLGPAVHPPPHIFVAFSIPCISGYATFLANLVSVL